MPRPMFALKLGAFAPSVEEQLASQGLKAVHGGEDAIEWDKDRHAIKRLEMRGVLTEAEAEAARRRFMREVGRYIEPLGEGQTKDA